MEAQVLDAMDLERERGITIKAHPVRLHYKARERQAVRPQPDRHAGPRRFLVRGHALAGRVRRRAAARRCVAGRRGADARQRLPRGRRAASRSSRSSTRSILPGAQPDETRRQIEDIVGLPADHAILASAKEGIGTEEILEAIVERLPIPKGATTAPLKALIFDSWYDPYRGVVIVVRMIDGVIRPGMKMRLMATAQDYQVEQVGVFLPKPLVVDELGAGEVGFIVANIKKVDDAKIGDTVTEAARPTPQPFPGFKELKPMVFAGLYPVEGHEYPRAARGAREAAAERRVALLRAGDVGGARLRLPLRVPRPAAHGDRAGAARARVRHGPGDDGAGRAVPRDDDRRRGARDRQPGEAAGSRAHRQARGAGDHGDDPDAVGARRRDPAALPGQARRPEEARVPRVRSRAHHLRAAVQRGRARLLRPAEDALARAMPRSTTTSPATGNRRSSSSTSS